MSSATLQGSSICSTKISDTSVPDPLEVEGEKILRGHDFQAILLLLRFWPYADGSHLSSILQNRPDAVINTLLTKGCGVSRKAVAGMSRSQRLEQLDLRPPSPALHQNWTPRRTIDEGPEHIATMINEQSCQQFSEIPFQHLLKHALGFYEDSLDDFFYYHTTILPTLIRLHLQMNPDQLQKYCRVLDVCSLPLVRSCPLITLNRS